MTAAISVFDPIATERNERQLERRPLNGLKAKVVGFIGNTKPVLCNQSRSHTPRQPHSASLHFRGVLQRGAVLSGAKNGHDRDYDVFVIEDCCCALSEEQHQAVINQLKRMRPY